ncbi:scarecrow-like protein 33 [Malania oleifera]|uniref:scarecrow-like protein 33 n=1 Tax=Malania oleifera TaxID=397392 RepID=UPI0025ADE0EE|nr:scarecrow-like protein 33 [Malania oleifera]
MDSQFDSSSNPTEGFELNAGSDQNPLLTTAFEFKDDDQNPFLTDQFELRDDSFDINFRDFPSPPLELDSVNLAPLVDSSKESDFSDLVEVIDHILREEDMQNKSSMFHDPLALQAAEKSFGEVHGNDHSPSHIQPQLQSPNNFSSDCGCSSSSGIESVEHLVQPGLISDRGEHDPSFSQSSPLLVSCAYHSTVESTSQMPLSSLNSSGSSFNGLAGSSLSTCLAPNAFNESETAVLFRRGMEEASKFLPRENLLTIGLESLKLPPKSKGDAPEVEERKYSQSWSKGRKNHHREDINTDIEEGRSNKQSAVYVEETELPEMFDRVLLSDEGRENYLECVADEDSQNGAGNSLQRNGEPSRLNARSPATKRRNKKEGVDLRTLLILCAQAVNADDNRTANELLKQIWQHCSPSGDGSQRTAHYFADALEARLAGTGTQLYTAIASKRTSAADMLKAYQLYLSASPSKKIAIKFSNHYIFTLSEKATTLHIIDFGIQYGFQWPMLIQRLSARCKLLKLRITGIDLPQPGFRPAERVEETGRRLAKYCERFNIPFEYNAIAQKWESIQIEDLKINRNELIAVNCLFRSKNLLDETVMVNSPRNDVLNLILKINPDIFTHSVANGSFSSPYFVTRFREAFFHFSALFDMLDTNLTSENEQRMMFEREFCGWEIMNVIACEGLERVVRPETYKQWHVRSLRAGFRKFPLDRELVEKLRAEVKAGYHKDFVVEEDGHWMLQGWKGRIIYASSCWISAQKS